MNVQNTPIYLMDASLNTQFNTFLVGLKLDQERKTMDITTANHQTVQNIG